MNDVQTLICVLVVIYLLECVAVVPWAGSAFVAWAGRRFRVRARGLGSPLERSEHRIHALPPLPPLGTVFLASEWPVELEPHGIVLTPASGLDSEVISYPGEDLRREGATLRFGSRSVTTWSPRFAAHVESVIQEVSTASLDSRRERIAAAWRKRLDTAAVRRDADTLARACRGLRLSCNAHFGIVLVIAPAALITRGIALVWLEILAVYLISALILVSLFLGAAARLGRGTWTERWEDVLTLVLSPLSAIRACDRLSRDQLAAYHPLAIARALADDKDFRSLASLILRDRRFRREALLQIRGGRLSEAGEIAFRELKRFLEREADDDFARGKTHGVSVDSLAYCPVCLQEYSVAGGVCSECTVPLVAFAPTTLERNG